MARDRLGDVGEPHAPDLALGALPAGLQGRELGLDVAPAGGPLGLREGPGQGYVASRPAPVAGVDPKRAQIGRRVSLARSGREKRLRRLGREQQGRAVRVGQAQPFLPRLGMQFGIGSGEQRKQGGNRLLDLLGADVADQVERDLGQVPASDVAAIGRDVAVDVGPASGFHLRAHLKLPCRWLPPAVPQNGRTGGASLFGRPF